jgi:hypothetical protein
MKRPFIIFAGVVSLVIPLKGDAQTSTVPWWTINMGFAVGTSSNSRVNSAVGGGLVGRMTGPSSMVETGFLADTLLRGTIVSVGVHEEVPGEYALRQNYPNPFNPSTTIKYELPKASDVRLTVFDLLGREVSVLVNERRDAGVHEVKFDASESSSGVYFFRLKAGDFVQTRKLLLLK